MERRPSRRSGATWTLLGVTTLIAVLLTVSAARSALVAAGVVDPPSVAADGDTTGLVGLLDRQGLRVAEGMAALAVVPLAISCLVLLAGMLRWTAWSREGAIGVFGLSGLFLLVMSLNGLGQEGNAGLGLLAGLTLLAVAGLVLSPPVRRDFERVEIARRVREREVATAARRARSEQS